MTPEAGPSTAFISVVAAGAGAVLSALASAIVVGWKGRGYIDEANREVDTKMRTLETGIDARIRSVEAKHDTDSRTLENSIREMINEALHMNGEGLTAIRTKMTDIEIWGRDNYVRREDYMESIRTIHRSLEAMSAKLDAGLKELRAEMSLDTSHLMAKIESLHPTATR
jgi:hypothetical protein